MRKVARGHDCLVNIRLRRLNPAFARRPATPLALGARANRRSSKDTNKYQKEILLTILDGGIIIRGFAVTLSWLVVLALIYLFIAQSMANPTSQANIHGSYVASKFSNEINPFNFNIEKEYCSINSTDTRLEQICQSENMPEITNQIRPTSDGIISSENNKAEKNQESIGEIIPTVINYFNISIQADDTAEALSFINETLSCINKSIYEVPHLNDTKDRDGGGASTTYERSPYNGKVPKPVIPKGN